MVWVPVRTNERTNERTYYYYIVVTQFVSVISDWRLPKCGWVVAASSGIHIRSYDVCVLCVCVCVCFRLASYNLYGVRTPGGSACALPRCTNDIFMPAHSTIYILICIFHISPWRANNSLVAGTYKYGNARKKRFFFQVVVELLRTLRILTCGYYWLAIVPMIDSRDYHMALVMPANVCRQYVYRFRYALNNLFKMASERILSLFAMRFNPHCARHCRRVCVCM